MRLADSPRGAIVCAACLLLTAALGGCATPPTDPAKRAAFEQTNDPLEPMNRKILDFNLFFDRILFKPVTKVYVTVLPEEARDALRRALDNMKEPIVVINNVLQGELHRAGIAVERFAINTTVGVGGLLDVAKRWGVKKEGGDFGQTLYVWGLPQGPYLVVPILGPSNPRDLLGMGADAYIDPFSYLATAKDLDEIEITRFILGGVDQRAQASDVLDDLQKNSLDFYSQLRSLTQQHRAAELRRGAVAQPGPGFYEIPAAAPAKPPAGTAPPSPPPGSSRP